MAASPNAPTLRPQTPGGPPRDLGRTFLRPPPTLMPTTNRILHSPKDRRVPLPKHLQGLGNLLHAASATGNPTVPAKTTPYKLRRELPFEPNGEMSRETNNHGPAAESHLTGPCPAAIEPIPNPTNPVVVTDIPIVNTNKHNCSDDHTVLHLFKNKICSPLIDEPPAVLNLLYPIFPSQGSVPPLPLTTPLDGKG